MVVGEHRPGDPAPPILVIRRSQQSTVSLFPYDTIGETRADLQAVILERSSLFVGGTEHASFGKFFAGRSHAKVAMPHVAGRAVRFFFC